MEATPEPVSGTAVGEDGALLVSVRLPEKFPAEAGAKATLKEDEPPGAIESGVARPAKE